MPPQSPFSIRRLQAICRVSAYVLLVEFLLNLLRTALPLPSSFDPSRLLNLVNFLLTVSSMPLLAIVLLFAGLSNGVRPARWEWWCARLLRPLLVLVAVLYALLIPPTLVLSQQMRTMGDGLLRAGDARTASELKAYRSRLSRAADPAALRQLMELQPRMRTFLSGPESPFREPAAPLARQRQLSLQLLDRLEIGLQDASLQRRADAAGDLQLQQLRLCGLALLYGVFFALVSLIWPGRLIPMAVAFPEAADSAAADPDAEQA